MENTPEITKYIEAARSSGVPDETIVRILKRAGWSDNSVADALAELVKNKTGLVAPAPAVSRGEAARDAFLYILALGTLGTWAIGLGSLIFELLNYYLPDIRNSYYGSYSIANQLAAIIVGLPIYLITMRFINRDVAKIPEKQQGGIRRWLVYLTILVAAGTVIGDLITFLTSFFQGELTIRFTLKVVTVFVIAGGVFAYYFLMLKTRRSLQK
ncbi:MAG: hypothetical protein HY978_04725 [Candidatus Liptonbacteria bacterium]|nr:hypothetical protein [Candidatus Liptonbacteria bacterium]